MTDARTAVPVNADAFEKWRTCGVHWPQLVGLEPAPWCASPAMLVRVLCAYCDAPGVAVLPLRLEYRRYKFPSCTVRIDGAEIEWSVPF